MAQVLTMGFAQTGPQKTCHNSLSADIIRQMPEPDDITLLKQYAGGDESAFTALFERYVNLVYSTAIRQVRNSSHAEEITQAVFILLARKAKSLSPKMVLSGWLYQAARLTTASLIKREVRRERREQELYMQTLMEPDTSLWEQISPLLDEAMGRLGEQDRNAIVLRFFENRTPLEVAATMKLSEVTARKRVSRVLEKLRKFFAKRGVVSTTVIIAGAISGHSVQAAPAALANSSMAVAIAKGVTASASTLTLVHGAMKLMAWTKAKMAIVAGVVILLAAGTTTLTVREDENHRTMADSAFDPWKTLDLIFPKIYEMTTNSSAKIAEYNQKANAYQAASVTANADGTINATYKMKSQEAKKAADKEMVDGIDRVLDVETNYFKKLPAGVIIRKHLGNANGSMNLDVNHFIKGSWSFAK